MGNNKPTKQKMEEMEAHIRMLESMVAKLSTDPSYGILTRQALELDLSAREEEVNFIAFLDVDYLHDFNSRFGHEEANRRIRSALHLRSGDVIVSGKWYSGDEIVILLSGNPEAFCDRLRASFVAEGMSITIAASPYTGNLVQDVEVAKIEVFRLKAKRGDKGR
jgi:GGDEF domain-containing protein